MQLRTTHKEILLYGTSMGLLLLSLKWLEVHFIVYNFRLDFFIGSIAILFTLLGVWVAHKLIKSKPASYRIETRIVEKEIYIHAPLRKEINQQEIEKLGISKRELDVLNLMAQGLSNDEIAAKLFVSLNTIKTHSSNIFFETGCKTEDTSCRKS